MTHLGTIGLEAFGPGWFRAWRRCGVSPRWWCRLSRIGGWSGWQRQCS